MKILGIVLTTIFAVFGLNTAYNGDPVNAEKESLIMDAVVHFLEQYHFDPQSIDDEFSLEIYDMYLKSLDGGKRFLTQEDIASFEMYKLNIDDQIKSKSTEFFDLSLEKINQGISRAENIFTEIVESEIELNTELSIEMDSEKRSYPKDESDLKQHWQNLLSYDMINRINDKMNEEPDSTGVKPSMDEIKEEALGKMKDSYSKWFKRLKKIRRSDRFEAYINTMTQVFDPHSGYFNPKEKEDFDIRMGGKLEGIGARLQSEGDYTKVVSIIPGGPAWKGKELEAEDLIIKVKQDGEEPVEITGMYLDEVVSQIRGDKGTLVTLTIKKKDGNVMDIVIERDEVIIDESFARSLILDVPDVIDNVGYIKLPKFYSSFEGKDGSSCAVDVALEIEKLNNEDVSGIILDLRNNGGGSLQDVVTMSGLFIEDGPIVQVKPRDKEAFVHNDIDETVQYDGPLIVMVNQFSASASEILAAALQDYDRAVIVGSKSTFGKGTVQRFVDLDRAFRGSDELKPLGNLKVTMQKFYRINGGSTQLKGVTPDIILPNDWHYMDTGEKDYEYPLEWSQIEPVEFSQDVYTVPSINLLRTKSEIRTSSKLEFSTILDQAKYLEEIKEDSTYPLNLDSFSKIQEMRKENAENYDMVYEDYNSNLSINNLDIDLEYINSDESRVARNEDWVKSLSEDFYLEETLYILNDMIDQERG